ncbi:MAG: hypothetical protein P8K80_02515, partial [Phycisphaerales bacterium]|nr:hypothetical protein [Phycisphaerales bacterium]
GVCGCGTPDVDSDSDGVLDCEDGCPNDPDKIEPGACGCGTPETDSDGDGIPDCIDCSEPDDPNDGIHAYPCEYTSIQAAIDAAAPGDVVLIAAGTHPLDATIDTNGRNITIRGELDVDGNPGTILDGQGSQVIHCQAGAPGTTFEYLAIENGYDAIGGGMNLEAGSNITMNQCAIRNNSTPSYGLGGGFAAAGNSTATLVQCVIEDNDGSYAGGFYTSGTVNLQDCIIRNNTAGFGGGCYNDGTVSLSGTTMCGNTPDNFAGPGTINDLGDNCLVESCDDSDGDGTYDCNDGCPDDPNKIEPGICGCGVADDDSDGDGTIDCLESNCPSDVDGSGTVDVIDLLAVISAWGPCDDTPCDSDVDGSGSVDVIDLLAIISAWGDCPRG